MFRELREYGALGDRIYSVTIESSRSHQLAQIALLFPVVLPLNEKFSLREISVASLSFIPFAALA